MRNLEHIVQVLCLMRIIFGLTLHWHNLYAPSTLRSDRELLPKAEFVSSKLSMKAHRQLQGRFFYIIISFNAFLLCL